MNGMTPKQILKAVDGALETASRWPRLLAALDLDNDPGQPTCALLNDALEHRGFHRILDERDRLSASNEYPDVWWAAIAKEVAGRGDATVEEVVTRLRGNGTT